MPQKSVDRIYFVMVHVRPGDQAELQECSGAFVNGWIEAPSLARARAIARKEIAKRKWSIVKILESYEVDESTLKGAARKRYKEAKECGASFAVYSYDEESDVMH